MDDIDSSESAVIHHCIEKVENENFWLLETQHFNNADCIGDPDQIERKICQDTYCNCYGEPENCDTATIINYKSHGTNNCTDFVLSKYIYVIDECVSYNGGTSTKLQCNNEIITDLSYVSHTDCDAVSHSSSKQIDASCVSIECNYAQNNVPSLYPIFNTFIIAICILIIYN